MIADILMLLVPTAFIIGRCMTHTQSESYRESWLCVWAKLGCVLAIAWWVRPIIIAEIACVAVAFWIGAKWRCPEARWSMREREQRRRMDEDMTPSERVRAIKAIFRDDKP